MSRFVSGGTFSDDPSASTPAEPTTSTTSTDRDEAWTKAQAAIDATKQQKKTEAGGAGLQEGGKTLYETLQANKAAKQEAFEESTRLRNQFRSLDEDEVEFLESVLASTRQKDAEVKREQASQLEAFRRQQEEAEKAASAASVAAAAAGSGEGDDDGEEGESWAVTGGGARKRKKGREKTGLIGGVKVRRTSSSATGGAKEGVGDGEDGGKAIEGANSQSSTTLSPSKHQGGSTSKSVGTESPSPPPVGLGLAAYSSDESD